MVNNICCISIYLLHEPNNILFQSRKGKFWMSANKSGFLTPDLGFIISENKWILFYELCACCPCPSFSCFFFGGFFGCCLRTLADRVSCLIYTTPNTFSREADYNLIIFFVISKLCLAFFSWLLSRLLPENCK